MWDTADAHLQDTFGFSILRIVRDNPKEWTVHFGGRRGKLLRRSYLALETAGRDGKSMVCLTPLLFFPLFNTVQPRSSNLCSCV